MSYILKSCERCGDDAVMLQDGLCYTCDNLIKQWRRNAATEKYDKKRGIGRYAGK